MTLDIERLSRALKISENVVSNCCSYRRTCLKIFDISFLKSPVTHPYLRNRDGDTGNTFRYDTSNCSQAPIYAVIINHRECCIIETKRNQHSIQYCDTHTLTLAQIRDPSTQMCRWVDSINIHCGTSRICSFGV